MKNLITLLILINTPVYAAKLTVKITDIQKVKGKMMVGIHSTEETYQDEKKTPFYAKMYPVTDTTLTFTVDLVDGNYAVAAFHDENEDQKLNTNFIGIPKELFGFSNNPTIFAGKPSYKKISFDLSADKEIYIKLKDF